jgi:3-dehydroquinate synthase
LKTLHLDGTNIEIGQLEKCTFSDLLIGKYAHSRKVILVDENTHDHCLEFLITAFSGLEEAEVMLLPAGEENKVMEVCFQVWEALSEYQISRSDLIINLGGGVVTDMGGFIAAVFKRGVDFINIPTSLLGMVDAAIGGKTGVDLGPYKNQLGVFKQPTAVFIDPRFLASLPQDEWKNGFAELLKHALISDEKLWDELTKISFEELIGSKDWEKYIAQAVTIKSDIVARDPMEKGERKLLNFGHTIGHGIEGFCLENETPIAHGHGVALGMIAESYLSMKKGFLSEDALNQIVEQLNNRFEGIEIADKEAILKIIQNDKKNDSAGIKCVLLNKIGAASFDHVIANEEIIESLDYLIAMYKQ